MPTTETLRQLESCYQTILPAQEDSYELFIWLSGLPHPMFNAVMHCKDPEQIEEVLHKIPITYPFSVWISSDPLSKQAIPFLKERGFTPIITCPLMLWDVQQIELKRREIRQTKEAVFSDIVAEVFAMDEATKNGFARLMSNDHAENYLIYEEGTPIGTGSLVISGYSGGLFNLAILPMYQKRGYGVAMTQFLMQRAYQLRLQQVVLLSSPMAEKIYQKLGFNKVDDIIIYSLSH